MLVVSLILCGVPFRLFERLIAANRRFCSLVIVFSTVCFRLVDRFRIDSCCPCRLFSGWVRFSCRVPDCFSAGFACSRRLGVCFLLVFRLVWACWCVVFLRGSRVLLCLSCQVWLVVLRLSSRFPCRVGWWGWRFFSVPCEIMGGLAGVIAAVLVSCLFAVVYRVVDCDGVFPLIV